MSTTVAQMLVETLHTIGVRQIFGVVGDALNPFTEAVRKDKRIEWIGVRHEEGAALAAAGQAKLTGKLAVCCGTTGPGANHLVAGLYEARKDHAPVLAISGGVPAASTTCRKTTRTCCFATSPPTPRPSLIRRRRCKWRTKPSRRLTTSAASRTSASRPT
ncbi:thiamine pyrophosphate-binding protein [Herbaspirillum lusitanum]|uniref:thiamine pyrophosphate-binding protein n=1 Tax=Herbaspirillum lusitanum TaxID=213312 RepID=UPI001EE64FBF|nr:thiamine pyrophosphate-binding protein [Herbaspirillum lusitanum]